jgi:hypothetical protein
MKEKAQQVAKIKSSGSMNTQTVELLTSESRKELVYVSEWGTRPNY